MTAHTSRRARIGGALAWLLGMAAGACTTDAAFECDHDGQCGAKGQCELDGYCSFEDPQCPSGRRYGSFAPSDTAQTCVPPSDVGSDSGGADSGGTDGPAPTTCSPGAPAGWSGPIVAWPSFDDAPPCPDDTSVDVFVAHADMQVDATTCECECGNNTGSCPTAELWASGNALDPDTCGPDSMTPVATITETCTPLTDGASSMYYLEPDAETAGLSCTAAAKATTPSIEWSGHVRACAPDIVSSCGDGGTVLPQPAVASGAGICIYRDGDVPCPLQGYTERALYHRGVTDTRGCTECTCRSASADEGGFGSACAVQWYGDEACSLLVDTAPMESQCVSGGLLGMGYGSVRIAPADDGCIANSQPQPTGEVTPSDPVTLCCLPCNGC